MRCDAFDSRLNELLDRRIRPEYDSRLVAHASVCARCGESLALAQLVTSDLAKPLAGCSPDLARRVANEFCPVVPRSSRPASRRRGYWIAAAIGASIVVAAIGVYRAPVDGPAEVVASGAPVAIEPPLTSSNEENLASIAARPDEFQAAPISGFARGLGESVARGMVLPGMTSAVGPVALIEPDALPPELTEHWESLRPLTAPVAAVVDALRKSLPRLSERPDSRSSSVVDLRRSVV
jgi:hypothetical protein